MEMYKPRAYKQQFMVWCEFQTKKDQGISIPFGKCPDTNDIFIISLSVSELLFCLYRLCRHHEELLFSLTDAERKEVLEKYSLKQPEPLNRQFLERKSKEEAGKDYRARQQMSKTSVVPSG